MSLSVRLVLEPIVRSGDYNSLLMPVAFLVLMNSPLLFRWKHRSPPNCAFLLIIGMYFDLFGIINLGRNGFVP